MTISSLLANITDAIAGISVTGVTIRDKDELAGSFIAKPNTLYPNPEGFITDFGLEYESFTRGASALVNIRYTLNYRFIGTAVGDLGTMGAAYSDMLNKVVLIINAMITATAPYDGKVDMELGAVTVGAREDPAGNVYHGADIPLKISEMQNT